MKTVPATAGNGIIERKLQIVVAKKPVKSRPGSVAPAAVTGYAKRLQARRNSAGGFNRLLIEAGFFTALAIKALRADGHEVAVGFATLSFHKPIQGFQTDRKSTRLNSSH